MRIPLSVPASAIVASTVGFGGTVALVIAAAAALGADDAQTASMVAAVCLATALEALILSWSTRMPIITARSPLRSTDATSKPPQARLFD